MKRFEGVRRRLMGSVLVVGLVAGAPRSAPAASTPADPRAAEVAALCDAARARLDDALGEFVRVGGGFRPALAEARTSLRDAGLLLGEEGWPATAAAARMRLASVLRAIEGRIGRVARRAALGEVPRVRRALRGAIAGMGTASAFLQEVAPPAAGEPLSNANPEPAAAMPAPTQAAFTWTSLSPSSDSRTVYVSATRPDDNGDGLSPETAKKTLAAAYALLRDGYPDWMLLKKGDSWTEDLVNTPWGKSGRSASEPIVITSYGTGERPRIVNAACFSDNTSNLAIVDLSFDVSGPEYGQPWRACGFGQGSNYLIEGCYFARGGVNMQRTGNVKFRGNVVVDAWSSSGGSLGAYFDRTDNLLVEGNVFDHNGWREPNIERSWFTHNIYIQIDCTNVTVRNNIFARGSGDGCLQRPGGLNENNLYLQNPIALNWGYNAWSYDQSHAPGTIRNNVMLDACNISPGVPRGVGISIINSGDVDITGNVIAHQVNARWGMGITPGGEIQNLKIRNNIIYDWIGTDTTDGATIGIDLQGQWRSTLGSSDITGNVFNLSRGLTFNVGGNVPSVATFSANTYYNAGPATAHFRYWGADQSDAQWPSAAGETNAVFAQPNYKAPNRTIGTYMQAMSRTATLEAFLAEARLQSKANWRPEFTASVVNDYIRDGFTVQ